MFIWKCKAFRISEEFSEKRSKLEKLILPMSKTIELQQLRLTNKLIKQNRIHEYTTNILYPPKLFLGHRSKCENQKHGC